jgi:D-alanyl-D-alanine carboxypeptidase
MKLRRWKKWQVLIVSFGLLVARPILLLPQTHQPPKTIATKAELESYMNKLTDHGTPPGMSLAVIKNGKIIYSKGFGWADEPWKIRATSKTVYHWWSCTKIATAIAVFQLQEKGKLSLNDPVVRYLPFFEVAYPSETSKEVTILNLLNHSSGLPDPSAFTFMNWIHHDGEPPVNQTNFIKEVLPDYSKLKFEPGDHAEYSNIGYMVLGAIIEKVTGITYEDYIRQNILQPLGMNHTDFFYTNIMEPDEAAGAHPIFNLMSPLLPFFGGSYIRELDCGHIWMERVYTDQTPSTALIGSATDAAKLVTAYLNGGVFDGQRILSQESIATMTYKGQIKAKNEDSLNYRRQGIGWQIYSKSGRWILTHDGGGPGFSTKIQLYPDENLGFVLFTNDVTCETWKILNLAATLNW